MEFDDPELEPTILPVDARLSLRGSTAEFRTLFERLTAVTPAKETIAGTSFVHVRAVDDVVRLTATDGAQTLILDSTTIRINREGSALLPGHKLKAIFGLAPEEKISLTLVGNNATLTSGRAIWNIATPAGSNAPAVPDVTDIKLYDVPRRAFYKALQSTRRALPYLGGRKSLEQANVAAGAITASDGYRLIRQKVAGLSLELNFAIPKDTVDELLRSMVSGSDQLQMGASDDLIVVKDGNETLVSRQLVLDFPDLEPLLIAPALENQNSVIVATTELKDLVKRVRVSADPEYASVTLHFDKDKSGEWALTVSTRDRSGNSANESMFAMWEGTTEPFDLTLNHKFLTDLLEAYSGDLATLRVGTNSKTRAAPLLLRDDEVGFVGVIQQSLVR